MAKIQAFIDGSMETVETGHELNCPAASCVQRYGTENLRCAGIEKQHNYWQLDHTFVSGKCRCK